LHRNASRFRHLWRATLAVLVLASLHSTAALAERIDGYRSKMEKWVETRQILSREKSEWAVDRETLKASEKMLSQQKESLEAEIAELEQSTTFSDEERAGLLLRQAEVLRTRQLLEGALVALEADVEELAALLPTPLQKKLEPLLVQIPKDPENSRLPAGARLMNVLGILAQAEKWNSTATFVGETRDVGGDQKVAVRTLYWGLGQAVYVDAQGKTSGIGRPGDQGWVFTSEPDLAESAKQLLDIYEGNVDLIEFSNLPVDIR